MKGDASGVVSGLTIDGIAIFMAFIAPDPPPPAQPGDHGPLSIDGHPLSSPEVGALSDMRMEVKRLRHAVQKLTQMLKEKL